MSGTAGAYQELVSLSGVAEMADVSRPAVSNWRKRHDDFPKPVRETGAASSFRLVDIEAWLARHNKPYSAPGIVQRLWNAVDEVRGAATLESAMETGLRLLGLLAIGRKARLASCEGLETALRQGSDRAVVDGLKLLAEAAEDTVDPQLVTQDLEAAATVMPFLRIVYRLAAGSDAGELFEALLAAKGRSVGKRNLATPPSVVECVSQLAQPIEGTVYDPACGLGGLLYGAHRTSGSQELNVVGQEREPDTWRIARFRMLVHGIPARIDLGDTLATDQTSRVEADRVIASPPLGTRWIPKNVDDTTRWFAGLPPAKRADIAWLQHAINCLRPTGRAFVVTGSGLAFHAGATGAIRRRLIELGCVHAVIALPAGLYPGSGIPMTVWVMGRPGTASGEILLINAQGLGTRIGSQAELSTRDIATVSACYQAWVSDGQASTESVPHLCVQVEDALRALDANISPARWVVDPAPAHPSYQATITTAIDRWRTARQAASAESIRTSTATVHSDARDGVLDIPPIGLNELTDLLQDASSAARRVKLRELIDQRSATMIRSRRINLDLAGRGDVPLVQAGDLKDDWTFTTSSHIDPDLFNPALPITQPGDILIAGQRQLSIAVDHHGGVATAAPVHILRCDPLRHDPTVVAALLTSTSNEQRRGGATLMHTDLYSLELPLLDMPTQRRLAGVLTWLTEQRRRARELAAATEDVLANVVDGLASGTLAMAGRDSLSEVRP